MTSLETFLGFRIGESAYALPVAAIREVLHLVPMTEIPASPRGCLGLADTHGKQVAVFAPHLFLATQCPPPSPGKARILSLSDAAGGNAILVHEILGVIRLDLSATRTTSLPHVAGLVTHEDTDYALLDAPSLFDVKP